MAKNPLTNKSIGDIIKTIKERRNDTVAKFIVNVIITACVDVEIEAHDEEEARILAIEEADLYTIDDWSCEIDGVFREDEK